MGAILDCDDAAVQYINAWLEDGTPREIARALGEVARSRGMSELSGKTGLGRQALFAALLEPALRKKAALPRRPFKPYQAGRPCRKRLNPPRPATITRP